MPRRQRRIVPQVAYHLISRFVAREWFIERERDRRLYLHFLGRALERVSWRCLGYAIMSNHIHLVVIAGTEPLAEWLRQVHGPFADAINRERKRIGPMFVRGPKDLLVHNSGVGRALAYLHNNPVRAGVVASPSLSTWTSHQSYLGTAAVPPWLHVAEGLSRTGVDVDAFDAFVRNSSAHPVLGDVTSDEHLEELIDAYERAQLLAEKSPVRVLDPTRVLHMVASVAEVPIELLQSKRRGAAECRARVVAIICGERLGVSAQTIADVLRVTPQYVNRMLRTQPTDPQVTELVERVLRDLEESLKIAA